MELYVYGRVLTRQVLESRVRDEKATSIISKIYRFTVTNNHASKIGENKAHGRRNTELCLRIIKDQSVLQGDYKALARTTLVLQL